MSTVVEEESMMSYQSLGILMLGIFVVSLLYPWSAKWPGAKWLVHLPLLLLPVWFLYENAMPRDMNIRVDLLLIFPGMLIAALACVVKISLYLWHARHPSRPFAEP